MYIYIKIWKRNSYTSVQTIAVYAASGGARHQSPIGDSTHKTNSAIYDLKHQDHQVKVPDCLLSFKALAANTIDAHAEPAHLIQVSPYAYLSI